MNRLAFLPTSTTSLHTLSDEELVRLLTQPQQSPQQEFERSVAEGIPLHLAMGLGSTALSGQGVVAQILGGALAGSTYLAGEKLAAGSGLLRFADQEIERRSDSHSSPLNLGI